MATMKKMFEELKEAEDRMTAKRIKEVIEAELNTSYATRIEEHVIKLGEEISVYLTDTAQSEIISWCEKNGWAATFESSGEGRHGENL